MIDPTNRVFTNIQTYIASKDTDYGDIQYTIMESPLPEQFPTITLSSLDNVGKYDLMNVEGSVDVSYEIKVYSNEITNPTIARELLLLCDNAMKKMFFGRRGGSRMVRISEDVFYVVARYTRVLGDVNRDIPSFD